MAQSQATAEITPDFRSPDELARASANERLAAYSEDWVTAPRLADSGERLGAETQAQVRQLLARGIGEAAIRDAALQALAGEEAAIIRRHRLTGWSVFLLTTAIGVAAALTWSGRGDGHAIFQVLLLGGIGLMLAHGVHMHGIRRRARLIRSAAARKQVWRAAIAKLAGVPQG
mgnify:CR=1 FL=1